MNQIDEVLTALRQVIRATDLHSKYLNKSAGLTAPQLMVLQTLERNGPQTIGDIARAISLGQATVTTIVTRLENRGYLIREKSARDRRRVYVSLTAAGRKILATAPTPLQEKFVVQYERLENWEKSMILTSLQRVAQMMGASDIDASPILDIGDLDRDQNS